jgi:hypothetical protein
MTERFIHSIHWDLKIDSEFKTGITIEREKGSALSAGVAAAQDRELGVIWLVCFNALLMENRRIRGFYTFSNSDFALLRVEESIL